jgi:phospholipase/carboxylesterase
MNNNNQENQIVIFVLHGLGGSAWLGRTRYVRQLGKALPYNLKFILLQGKIIRLQLSKFYRVPVFLTGWYNIETHANLLNGEDDQGLLTTIDQTDELITEEINQGIPARNIFLLGFSQGGSVVLSMAMNSRHRLGGIISIAGFLPFYEALKKKELGLNKSVPILMIHGEGDKIVLCQDGLTSAKTLKNDGYQVEFVTYSQIGHADITAESEEKIIEFLQQTFTTRKIKPLESSQEPEIKTIKIDKNSPWPTILGSITPVPAFFYSLLKKKKGVPPLSASVVG